MADGQVSVELKLLTEKAEQQMKAFFGKMASSFGGSSVGGGGGGGKKSPVDQTTDAVGKQISQFQRLKITLGDVERAFRTLRRAATISDEGTLITSKQMRLPYLEQMKYIQRFKSFPSYAPGSSSIAPTASPIMGGSYHGASASTMAGSGGSGAKQNTLAGMASGMMNASLGGAAQTFVKATAALAGMRVVFGLWSWGIQMAIAPLAKLNQLINNMAEGARRVYAGSLQSGGMPVGFTSYRQTLARIMGVGEQEVFQYAKQVNYLNKQIAYSTSVSAKHNSVLTESSWKMSVVKNDWKSLMDSLAAAFVGPKNSILDFLHRVINTVTYNMQHVVSISNQVSKSLAMSEFMKSHGMEARVSGKGVAWLDKSGKMHPELRAEFEKIWSGRDKMPSPEASARRYTSSPWERMGLVLGSGMGDNPAVKTAYNTTKMLLELQKMNNPNSPLHPKPYSYTKPAGAAHP